MLAENPYAEKKVSEMVMDCASDFIMAGEDESDKQQRLNIAVSAWNFACVNKENRKRNIKNYLKDYQEMNPGAIKKDVDNVKRILKNIIAEKRRLYPDVKIQIYEATLKEKDGKTYVKVVSTKM
jgi:hypothetical protein